MMLEAPLLISSAVQSSWALHVVFDRWPVAADPERAALPEGRCLGCSSFYRIASSGQGPSGHTSPTTPCQSPEPILAPNAPPTPHLPPSHPQPPGYTASSRAASEPPSTPVRPPAAPPWPPPPPPTPPPRTTHPPPWPHPCRAQDSVPSAHRAVPHAIPPRQAPPTQP